MAQKSGPGQADARPAEAQKSGEDKPERQKTQPTGKTYENAFTVDEGVTPNFHVDKKLHGDTDNDSPDQPQAVVAGEIRPENNFSAAQTQSQNNETGADETAERGGGRQITGVQRKSHVELS